MATPMINGVQHSWASIKINMLGRTISGITSIMYSYDRAKVNNKGAGDVVDHRAYGDREAKAEATLYEYEVEAIQAAAREFGINDLTDIPPFDIVVTKQVNQLSAPVTDVIRNCEFTTNGRDMKQGDTKSEIKFTLITSHVDFAV